MDKKIIILILIIAISVTAVAQTQPTVSMVNVEYDEQLAELNQKIEALNQQINQLITQNIQYREHLNQKIETLETKENSASSFIQLQRFIINNLNSLKIFFIVVMFVSNIILIGYFLLLKSKGLL